ncbi:hypothetical protein K440DRAFT_637271 [Wilcoxina mikolae CBS 423.85]|nr:hypothetical protein K440DRAFT_637271 [Wilcoxina mikolae CBS 423.85]
MPGIQEISDDEDIHAANIDSQKLLQLLRPHPLLHPQQTFGFDNPDIDDSSLSPALPLYQTISHQLLPLLTNTTPTPELVAVLAAFTSTSDPWTTTRTQYIASQFLSSTPSLLDREILIDGLLRDTLKPLFNTRTTSAARITSSGRIALRENTNRRINTNIPAWLEQRPESVAILEWVLSAIPNTDLEAAWGLLIPPILTLIDSTLSSVKTRAIGMITLLLQRLEEIDATRTLLQRTGLAPVFWDAVLPCLSYLPPLTPTPESVPLLKAAYTCLLPLARARETNLRKRSALLDILVREGFLRGLAFADEHVLVIVVMVSALSQIVEEMGVWAVRHLKSVVPALAEILANPFGDTFPPLLVEAAKTLKVVVRTCWPRMREYVAEVMRGVAMCWGRIYDEEEDKELEGLRGNLREVVEVLRAVVENEDGGKERWKQLEQGVIEVDETAFAGLFEQVEDGGS